MLYLLKGSRVREYHQQNVGILGAPEGEVVEVAYNRRWVQPELGLEPGMGAVIVYADSPYDYFVPVRFVVVGDVEPTESGVLLRCRLGPFVRAGGQEALNILWSRADRPLRPGKVFLFEDENPGLLGPQGRTEEDVAWRAAVDGLHRNGFYERTTVARVVSLVGPQGEDLLADPVVQSGAAVVATLETRSPLRPEPELPLLIDAEPREAIGGTDRSGVPSTGVTQIRFVVSGTGTIAGRFTFPPDALLSSRPGFRLESRPRDETFAEPPRDPDPHRAGADALAIRSLVTRLRRESALDDRAWFGIYQDLLLEWLPTDPVLLAAFARHAYGCQDYGECHRALAAIEARVPDDDYLFLLASLRTGRDSDVVDLMEQIDLKEEERFEQFLTALDGVSQPLLKHLLDRLPNKLLGEDKTVRFLERAWGRVQDVSVACQIAETTAYADPDRGAQLLLDRWDDPATMPQRALTLVLDWEARPSRLCPYLEYALERALQEGDISRVDSLVVKARRLLTVPRRTRTLAWVGRTLLLDESDDVARSGFALIVEASHEAAGFGVLDVASEYATAAVAYAELSGDDDLRVAADGLKSAVDRAIESSDRFRSWQEMEDDSAVRQLAPRLRGRALHFVGGLPRDWLAQFEALPEVVDVRWHETEKNKSANIDWASHLDADRDVVVVITDHVGHDTTVGLRTKCAAKGVAYLHGSSSLREVIAALQARY